MKWMIASDIHGSAAFCRQLSDALEREQPDKLLLLGDLLYHGPRNDLPAEYDPKAVAAMLNAHKERILCVRGNCDSEVDQMMLAFPILADYALIAEGQAVIFATHGHLYHKDHLPPLQAGQILLHGHTHVPLCDTSGDICIMNPGSVSIPKEGSHHGYMTLHQSEFLWKDLSGNVCQRYLLPAP